MSKSLPMPALAFALLSAACDPVITSVVALAPHDSSTVPDARVVDAPDDDKDGTALDPEEEDPEGCLLLRDQTFPEVVSDPAELAKRLVISRNASDGGCTEGDAGMALGSASVFSRRDGLPMVERGKRYSYRWPVVTTAVTRVNLVGGAQFCAASPVINAQLPAYQFVEGGQATCFDFTSPIDARYVRIDGRDFPSLQWLNFGKPPLKFRLCPTPCPEGTAATELNSDAGALGYDASTPAIPGVP